MMKCNVTICGVVSKAATCRTNKDGKPFVTFSVAVVIPAKNGINKNRMTTTGKGGKEPIYTPAEMKNLSKEEQEALKMNIEKNRRVEFFLNKNN